MFPGVVRISSRGAAAAPGQKGGSTNSRSMEFGIIIIIIIITIIIIKEGPTLLHPKPSSSKFLNMCFFGGG